MKKGELKEIPIEEAMAYFKEEGMDLEREEVEQIMGFLYSLTMIIIQEYFDIE